MTTSGRDLARERREYATRVRAQLDEWNRDVDELARKADRFADGKKKEVRRELEELKRHRERLYHILRDLDDVESTGWGDLAEGADEAIAGLRESLSRVTGLAHGDDD